MADWRISGNPASIGCSGSLPGDHVEDITTGNVYVKTGSGTTDFTIATSAYNGAVAVGTLTVEEADGSPSCPATTTLRFDQADGFVVTQVSAAIARVDITGIPEANVTNLVSDLAAKAASSHTHPESDVTSLVSDLAAKEATANKGAASGYCALDGSALVANASLPTAMTGNARVAVTKAGVAVGTRRGLNLIEGSNVTLTVADNSGSERVDVTVTAAAGTPADGTITMAKLADIATNTVIGRGAAGTGVPSALTVTSPVTTTSTTLAFDQTVTLGNNARVAVAKNSGATVGTRRQLNLIEGSNITLTVTDTGASERVDVTIAGAAGASVGGINTGITASSTTTLGSTKSYGSLHRIDTVSATIDYITTTGWTTGTAFIIYNNSAFTLNLAHNTGGVPVNTAAIFGPGSSSASISAKFGYWVMYDGTFFRVISQ